MTEIWTPGTPWRVAESMTVPRTVPLAWASAGRAPAPAAASSSTARAVRHGRRACCMVVLGERGSWEGGSGVGRLAVWERRPEAARDLVGGVANQRAECARAVHPDARHRAADADRGDRAPLHPRHRRADGDEPRLELLVRDREPAVPDVGELLVQPLARRDGGWREPLQPLQPRGGGGGPGGRRARPGGPGPEAAGGQKRL